MNRYSNRPTRPQTTGVEELEKVRGDVDHQAIMQEAERILVANASTSIPNVNGYELLVKLTHLRDTRAKLMTFVVPGAELDHSIIGTPYSPKFWKEVDGDDSYLLVPDQKLITEHLEVLQLKDDPIQRVRNMISRSLKNESVDLDSLEDIAIALNRIEKDKLARISSFISSLPATVFATNDGVPFIEKILNQRLEFMREIHHLVLDDDTRLDDITSDLFVEYLETHTLKDLLQVLGRDYERKVALTFTCSECGMSSKEGKVKHVVLFCGEIFHSSGKIKGPGKNGVQLKGCKMLGNLTQEDFVTQPLSKLINAGFMLSGSGIYAATSVSLDTKSTTLSMVNYTPARGTVAKTAELWKGPMFLTPKINVLTRDKRDASYWELKEYLIRGEEQVSKIRNFARNIPPVVNGKTSYDFILK